MSDTEIDIVSDEPSGPNDPLPDEPDYVPPPMRSDAPDEVVAQTKAAMNGELSDTDYRAWRDAKGGEVTLADLERHKERQAEVAKVESERDFYRDQVEGALSESMPEVVDVAKAHAHLNGEVGRARARYDDFEDVVMNPDLPITPTMKTTMGGLSNAGDVMYHLGKHPQVARQISEMSPTDSVMEIGKLSTKLAGSSKPKTTSAPDPIKTVGGGGASPPKDPDKMSYDEYKRYRGLA